MPEIISTFKSGNQLSKHSILSWRIAQAAVWLVGALILFCLFFYPSVGLVLFWNILIPVAPVLFVVEAGLWRNVCPLATTNLLPRHWGLSKTKKLSAGQQGVLNLLSVILLYTIVPLRHAIFNRNGLATGLLIVLMVITGMVLGFFYEWKSAWCSGLCPVHPVEKLYGGNTLLSLPNAHCSECQNCVVPCPDSTPNITPASAKKTFGQQLSGLLIIGGLPGFIWGWFHVPDKTTSSINGLIGAYEMPLLGFAVSFILYIILSSLLPAKYERRIISLFAASGVSCYYWFRIPALLGFSGFADDGLLIDLKKVLPNWGMTMIIIASTLFFFYWLVIRKQNNRSWVIRPQFANKQKLSA